eukprot:11055651-Heterocapsa_arctica.AAC.1
MPRHWCPTCCLCRAARCVLEVVVFAWTVLVVGLLFPLDSLRGVGAWASHAHPRAGPTEELIESDELAKRGKLDP